MEKTRAEDEILQLYSQSPEKSIHDKFRHLAQEIWDKEHICVRMMYIDWHDCSSPIKSEMHVNQVRLDTITK